MATENLETVRRFCDAFSRRNPDEILEYFTENAVYHNMPMPPVQGKAGIKTVLDMFLKQADSAEFIILKIAEGDDGAVPSERAGDMQPWTRPHAHVILNAEPTCETPTSTS